MSMQISAAVVVEPAAVVVASTMLVESYADAAAEMALVDNWDVVEGVELVDGYKKDTKVLEVPNKSMCAKKDETSWQPVRHDNLYHSEATDGDKENRLNLAFVQNAVQKVAQKVVRAVDQKDA